MRLSIRNRFDGVVTAVTRGDVMARVRVRLSGGQLMTAAITTDALDDLKIRDDQQVTALIKSTEVSLAIGEVGRLSMRNQFPATVSMVERGTLMTTVVLTIAGGELLTAVITSEAAEEMELAEGDPVTVLAKSTSVSLAVN